jgi:hypothetical protein
LLARHHKTQLSGTSCVCLRQQWKQLQINILKTTIT